MAGILAHAGDAIETWWSALGRPSLTPEVRAKLIQAGDEVAKGKSISEWTQWRDESLIQVLKLQETSERQLTGTSDSSLSPSNQLH